MDTRHEAIGRLLIPVCQVEEVYYRTWELSIWKFSCGLQMTDQLAREMTEFHAGVFNSVHQRHHDLRHDPTEIEDWDMTFQITYKEDGSEEGLTGWCSCDRIPVKI